MRSAIVEPDRLLQQSGTDSQLLAASLLDNYFGPIYGLALSILHDEAEADDVAQETFITALRHIDRYASGTNLKAWLSTIAVNLCRDTLRRRKARQRWSDLWAGAQRSGGGRRGPERRQVYKEANSALWQAVQRLDEKHRLPVILRYANGYSVREVADTLQVPEGTVHSRLHHACKRLAQTLVATDTEALVKELLND
jgi:RNA polymerase sigma-70 factor (ECF subfamily)